MANTIFDVRVYNQLQQLLESDFNTQGSQDHESLVTALANLIGANGFVGSGFQPAPTSPTGASLQVTLGAGYGIGQNQNPTVNVGGIQGLNTESPFDVMVLGQDLILTFANAAPAQDRIDLVEVALPGLSSGVEPQLTDPNTVVLLNPATGAATPGLVNQTLSWQVGPVATVAYNVASTASLSIKQGQYFAPGSAVAPTGTAGYLPVCRVLIPANQTAPVLMSQIQDARAMLGQQTNNAPVAWMAGATTQAGDRVLGVAGTPGLNNPPIVFEAQNGGTTATLYSSMPTWSATYNVLDNGIVWRPIGPFVQANGKMEKYAATMRGSNYGNDEGLCVDLTQLKLAPNPRLDVQAYVPGDCMTATVSAVAYVYRAIKGGTSGTGVGSFVNPASSVTASQTTQTDGTVIWWCVDVYDATFTQLLTTNKSGVLDISFQSPLNSATSASCGTVNDGTGTRTAITNMHVTLTSLLGRPILVQAQMDSDNTTAGFGASGTAAPAGAWVEFSPVPPGGVARSGFVGIAAQGNNITAGPACLSCIVPSTKGITYTITAYYQSVSGSDSVYASRMVLYAQELT